MDKDLTSIEKQILALAMEFYAGHLINKLKPEMVQKAPKEAKDEETDSQPASE